MFLTYSSMTAGLCLLVTAQVLKWIVYSFEYHVCLSQAGAIRITLPWSLLSLRITLKTRVIGSYAYRNSLFHRNRKASDIDPGLTLEQKTGMLPILVSHKLVHRKKPPSHNTKASKFVQRDHVLSRLNDLLRQSSTLFWTPCRWDPLRVTELQIHKFRSLITSWERPTDMAPPCSFTEKSAVVLSEQSYFECEVLACPKYLHPIWPHMQSTIPELKGHWDTLPTWWLMCPLLKSWKGEKEWNRLPCRSLSSSSRWEITAPSLGFALACLGDESERFSPAWGVTNVRAAMFPKKQTIPLSGLRMVLEGCWEVPYSWELASN